MTAPARMPQPWPVQPGGAYAGMTVPELRRALAHAEKYDKNDRAAAIGAELARRGAADR